MTCSLGSPVRKASSPAATASSRRRRRRRRRSRCVRTRSGPASKTSGSRSVSSRTRVEQLGRGDAVAGEARGEPDPGEPGSRPSQPEAVRDQRVVADLGVGVERQVVARRARCPPRAASSAVRARPGARAARRRRPRTGRGARARGRRRRRGRARAARRLADTPVTTVVHLVRARDLEPVRAVVREAPGIEQLVAPTGGCP